MGFSLNARYYKNGRSPYENEHFKLIMKECFLTWNGASFSAVTPAIIPPRIFYRATPGPAISGTSKCVVPCALCVLSTHILEWEDTLLPVSRLALRSGPHVCGQGDEEDDGEAVELDEGDEGRLHGWKQRSRLISLLVLPQHGLLLALFRSRNTTGKVFCLARDESVLHTTWCFI